MLIHRHRSLAAPLLLALVALAATSGYHAHGPTADTSDFSSSRCAACALSHGPADATVTADVASPVELSGTVPSLEPTRRVVVLLDSEDPTRAPPFSA